MIWELLPTGKKNKVSADDLMKMTGIQTKRELSAVVQRERFSGKLILSTKADGGGYYLPGDAVEVEDFIETYSGEARALFAMLKTARQYIKAAGGA